MSRVTQQPPRFSISQVSTLAASFADDVRAYAAAGVDGIGIWEMKLGNGSIEEFRASGLGSAICEYGPSISLATSASSWSTWLQKSLEVEPSGPGWPPWRILVRLR